MCLCLWRIGEGRIFVEGRAGLIFLADDILWRGGQKFVEGRADISGADISGG